MKRYSLIICLLAASFGVYLMVNHQQQIADTDVRQMQGSISEMNEKTNKISPKDKSIVAEELNQLSHSELKEAIEKQKTMNKKLEEKLKSYQVGHTVEVDAEVKLSVTREFIAKAVDCLADSTCQNHRMGNIQIEKDLRDGLANMFDVAEHSEELAQEIFDRDIYAVLKANQPGLNEIILEKAVAYGLEEFNSDKLIAYSEQLHPSTQASLFAKVMYSSQNEEQKNVVRKKISQLMQSSDSSTVIAMIDKLPELSGERAAQFQANAAQACRFKKNNQVYGRMLVLLDQANRRVEHPVDLDQLCLN